MTAKLLEFPGSAQSLEQMDHKQALDAIDRLIGAKTQLINKLRDVQPPDMSHPEQAAAQTELSRVIDATEQTLSRLRNAREIFVENMRIR